MYAATHMKFGKLGDLLSGLNQRVRVFERLQRLTNTRKCPQHNDKLLLKTKQIINVEKAARLQNMSQNLNFLCSKRLLNLHELSF